MDSTASRILYASEVAGSPSHLYVDKFNQTYVISGQFAGELGAVTAFSGDGRRQIYQVIIGPYRKERIVGGGIKDGGTAFVLGQTRSYEWSGLDKGSDPLFYAEVEPFKRSTMPAKASFGVVTPWTEKMIKLPFKNTGNAPITITHVSSTFKVYNNCSVILPGKTCVMQAGYFTHGWPFTTGTFTVESDSLDSPQSVTITGTVR